MIWPFTVQMNCFIDLKKFTNYQPSVSNFKKVFLTESQNNFGDKIPD
jgi:hypothetical protein